LFRDTLTDFAANFRTDLSDITIEADADMRPTIKNWNISGRYKGKAYELADAVDWFNQKGDKIQNCKVRDLRDAITESMERHLLK
jgi:nitrous oxidase accessory protein NosD